VTEPEGLEIEGAGLEFNTRLKPDAGSLDLNLDLVENIIHDHGDEGNFDNASHRRKKVIVKLPLV
jgi:hypothetical protein